MPSPEAIIPPNFTAPFDNEMGLRFTALSPDGARAQLEVTPKLLQPMGLVHGGVYCSMVESMASVAAHTWLNANGGGGNVVGVNNNTDFPALHHLRDGLRQGRTDSPRPASAAVAGHDHRRPGSGRGPGSGAAAKPRGMTGPAARTEIPDRPKLPASSQ
ncbi:hypothetical protein MHEI_42530 [Mycobacterium heidelbergense]|nr:hypothetical protein MHEI_42530 [Mycobacterium heidelbergense]